VRRLIVWLLLGCALAARAAEPFAAPPLHPSGAFATAGPEVARGALVWLHGSYDTDANPAPPAEPPWIARLAARGYDVWRFDRTPGADPLAAGGDGLARGLGALRQAGYLRIIVAGHSRGAMIALSVLAVPGLADAIAAISPAAHGDNPARRAIALSYWQKLMDAAAPGGPRLALVQLADDGLDLAPAERLAAARAAAARAGLPFLSIYQPETPRGHLGSYVPNFDTQFGDELAAFLDP
jgi:pimeloyl-ACP methyl ester carboxylesterase